MIQHDLATLKRQAALRALDYVHSGMTLGLGTGSTAEAFLEVLAPRVQEGLDIIGVATSEHIAKKARGLGIRLGALDELAPLDLDIDGADEADRALNLIKGGGGAHLREKIVAASSKRFIVIADNSKLVERLGKFPLPVEVAEFGQVTTVTRIKDAIASLGYSNIAITRRKKNGSVFRTDSGNVLYDCAFGAIADARALDDALNGITGVVEHGLFIGMAGALIIAGADGVEVIERKP